MSSSRAIAVAPAVRPHTRMTSSTRRTARRYLTARAPWEYSATVTELLDELMEWLRIPSISTGGGDPAEIERAAEWAAERVGAAGGEVELVRIGAGNPIVVGELHASSGPGPWTS